MHVQRAAEDRSGPGIALCTDVDSERLGTVPARYEDAAEDTGMALLCPNPAELVPEEFEAKLTDSCLRVSTTLWSWLPCQHSSPVPRTTLRRTAS